MRKFIYYLVPILTIIVFVLFMHSNTYLKKPTGQGDDVAHFFQAVKKDIEQSDWTKAYKDSEHLETAWQKIITRIQFNVDRDDVQKLDSNLARLKGYIEAKDKAGAMAELSEAVRHWHDLDK